MLKRREPRKRSNEVTAGKLAGRLIAFSPRGTTIQGYEMGGANERNAYPATNCHMSKSGGGPKNHAQSSRRSCGRACVILGMGGAVGKDANEWRAIDAAPTAPYVLKPLIARSMCTTRSGVVAGLSAFLDQLRSLVADP